LGEIEDAKEILIRRINGSEFEQAFKLTTLAFQSARERVGLAERDIGRLRRMARFYRLISWFIFFFDILHIDFETVLVAVSGDEVVGEVHVVPHGRRTWSIESAAVDSRFRGRGIFTNLMKEAVEYIARRRGERILGFLLTDNVAPIKIVEEKLGFEVFAEKSLLYFEISDDSVSDIKRDPSIGALQKKDIQQVYEICKTLDSKRMETYGFVPEDLFESFSRHLRRKLAGVHSKKWVLHRDGKTVGFVSITYTSPKEAGNIESFYVLPTKDSSERATILLRHVLNFLQTRNIRIVLVRLDKERPEILDLFRRFGFRHVAFSHEVVKGLV